MVSVSALVHIRAVAGEKMADGGLNEFAFRFDVEYAAHLVPLSAFVARVIVRILVIDADFEYVVG